MVLVYIYQQNWVIYLKIIGDWQEIQADMIGYGWDSHETSNDSNKFCGMVIWASTMQIWWGLVGL